MTTSKFPSTSQLVHKFLQDRRHPVTLIEPRVSLGRFTFAPFGWIGFYPSFDGETRSVEGTFAIDLAKTNLDFSFNTNCAGINLGVALEKEIIKMVDEQLFGDKKLYLLPVDEADSSSKKFRLVPSSEVQGIVENGPFTVYPQHLFPKDSKEALAIGAALDYERVVSDFQEKQVVPVTQADIDAAAAEFEIALSA